MRPCPPLLAAALADRSVRLWSADLYDFVTVSGTPYHWTSYDRDLTPPGGPVYTAQGPYLSRTKWNTVNTMQIPEMEVYIRATAASFNGGADLMSQLHNGLLDGASVTLNRTFMYDKTNTSLGTILLFEGVAGKLEIDGALNTLKVKGSNNLLSQYTPKNVFEVQCLHAFCDPNCTLLRAAFTSSFIVGASPTKTFVPWTAAPGTPGLFQLGTLTMTSGAGSGEERTIIFADATGVTLAYPLYSVPAPGDTFTAFQGCDKTQATCTARSNIQNWRGFPYVPPASTGV